MDIFKLADLYNKSTGKKEGKHQAYDYTICDYCGEKLTDDDCRRTIYEIHETAMIEPYFSEIKITDNIDRYDFFNNNDKFHFHIGCEEKALIECITEFQKYMYYKPLLHLYQLKANMIRKKLNKKELTEENIRL